MSDADTNAGLDAPAEPSSGSPLQSPVAGVPEAAEDGAVPEADTITNKETHPLGHAGATTTSDAKEDQPLPTAGGDEEALSEETEAPAKINDGNNDEQGMSASRVSPPPEGATEGKAAVVEPLELADSARTDDERQQATIRDEDARDTDQEPVPQTDEEHDNKQGGEVPQTQTATGHADPSLETPQEKIPPQSAASDTRELPAPPAPPKTSPPQPEGEEGEDEVAAVARAFGVSTSIGEAATRERGPHDTSVDPEKQSATTLAPAPTQPSSSSSSSAKTGLRIGKGPPPTTIASEEKPFDFNHFLDQMRHKSAGPVGEYVRSFIKGFTMKPYRAADQTKLIFDFLDFIALRMRECDVWANVSQTEFENATEAMEKLVMNRLYNYSFSPAVRREGKWNVQTDDLERDRVLKQRIKLFSWISEEHLDVPKGDHSKGFIDFAIQELLKINHYKAPRDKVICILNCCKVIFGLIRHLSTEENADTFVPILIFVVLRANPDHLISNVEYISRFRNPEKLSSESGYYLSSLMGAIAFIETMDHTSLSNITQEEFERKVEDAVLEMGSQNDVGDVPQTARDGLGSSTLMSAAGTRTPSPAPPMAHADESARVLPVSAGASALAEDTRAFFQRTGKAAKAGIGASLGGPMTAIGRLFQEGLEGPRTPSGASPAAASGRATPESPSPLNTGGQPLQTARSRMWGLFGTDAEDSSRNLQQAAGFPQAQQRPKQQSGGRTTSGASLNIGSWTRSMRGDVDEPPTPQSEELQQGRFATLEGLRTRREPLATPQGESHGVPSKGLPRRPAKPIRQGSIDPYSVQDDEEAEGVRTPSDDGSVLEDQSPSGAVSSRSRLADLGGLLPSFLSDQPSSQPHRGAPDFASAQQSVAPSPGGELNDEQASRAAAQIDRAHLDAGVDTLRSIFPHTDTGVCRLVLEGCGGNVQAAIDKLLEMS